MEWNISADCFIFRERKSLQELCLPHQQLANKSRNSMIELVSLNPSEPLARTSVQHSIVVAMFWMNGRVRVPQLSVCSVVQLLTVELLYCSTYHSGRKWPELCQKLGYKTRKIVWSYLYKHFTVIKPVEGDARFLLYSLCSHIFHFGYFCFNLLLTGHSFAWTQFCCT